MSKQDKFIGRKLDLTVCCVTVIGIVRLKQRQCKH